MSTGTPDQIHLSWSADPSTTLTVVWHTSADAGPGRVAFRPASDDDWTHVSATSRPSPGRGLLHEATLSGLSPGTDYEYRVHGGERGDASPVFSTRTAPAPGPADYRFVFLCDTGLIGRLDGNATGTARIIEAVVADRPLFVLGGGDYAYANRDGRFDRVDDAIDEWFVQWQSVLTRCPFMAQYGNHEVFLQERYEDWAPRFAHPESPDGGRNYSFEVGDVHITSLFVPGPPPEPPQLAWLEADLAAARKRGMRWLIVYQHEPIYGHGHSHPAQPGVRAALAPIFEMHRVDLHLSGHDQSYERTYPLRGVPEHPTPTSDARNRYTRGEGVIYAKVSPAGKMSEKRNDFSRFTTAQQPFMAVRDDSAHHYALVTVHAAGKIAVEAYSVSGENTTKSLLDAFTLVAG